MRFKRTAAIEIDLLARQSERHARIGKFSNGGNEADLNPNVENRNKGPREPPEKNLFSDEQIEKLQEVFHGSMFGYQRQWWEAGNKYLVRNLLKSRQIGATFFFAREALIDALTTGRNQIFLSASKAQAHVFKQYIIEFAREVDVDLKGDPMSLSNGACLYFLGTRPAPRRAITAIFTWMNISGFPSFRNCRKWHLTWRCIRSGAKPTFPRRPASPTAPIPSALLNESATLFRRKYYLNGSHAGFIMYMTDPAQSQQDVDNIRSAMKSAKGHGNFRNLFMYSPNGKKDGIQIIPLSEVAAKDEFLNIKNVSRDAMLAVHRVPPQMMGIIPNNTGGFGDVEKASRVFVRNELILLQKRFEELNDWLGDEIIKFSPYKLE